MPHKLAIFGTSGRTRRELAKVAGSKDWGGCGFVCPTSTVECGIAKGRIVRGNFDELDRVIETSADSEAGCCMIGPRPPYTDAFCTTATAGIIVAIKQAGCHRLVCQTGAMIGLAPTRSRPMEWMARAFARWQPQSARDPEKKECLVESSQLDWTIVKPRRLTDSPPQDRVQTCSSLESGCYPRAVARIWWRS